MYVMKIVIFGYKPENSPQASHQLHAYEKQIVRDWQ